MTVDMVLHDDSSFGIIGPAADLAARIAKTEFVPGSLRNRPEAVLACILAGHELGVGPMQSLSLIDIIDGRPAQRAQLARMLILSKGHALWLTESTITRCTMCGKRQGEEHVHQVTWTLDDAKRAGLDGKQNWRRYPKQMLVARCTGDLGRIAFADVLGGMPYLAEELEDGGFDNGLPAGPSDGALGGTGTASAPVTHRRRRGRPPSTRSDQAALPAPSPADRREEPPLEPPGEQAPRPSAIGGQLKASIEEQSQGAGELFDVPFEDTPRTKAKPKSEPKSISKSEPKLPAKSQPPVTENQSGESLTLNQQIAMVCEQIGLERRNLITAITGKTRGRDLTREEAGEVLERVRAIRRGDVAPPRAARKRDEALTEATHIKDTKFVTTKDGESHYEAMSTAGPFITYERSVYDRMADWEDIDVAVTIVWRVLTNQRRLILEIQPTDSPAGEELRRLWLSDANST